jgi:hypothetical protein
MTEEMIIKQVRRLRNVDLGDKRIAFITIDSEPCRTCVSFLNKLSQKTGIAFVVFGSRGVGPIVVRIGGKRREDVVGDVMPDSELDSDDEPPQTSTAESLFLPVSIPQPPSAPPPVSVPRSAPRPISHFKVAHWSPEDPEALLSNYKKKTPVYKYPGYEYTSSSTTDSDSSTGTIGRSPKAVRSPLGPIHKSAISRPISSIGHGHDYARVAYEVVNEKPAQPVKVKTTKAIERLRQDKLHRSRQHRACSRKSTYSTHKAQLQKFRYHPMTPTNKSILKNRYPILYKDI